MDSPLRILIRQIRLKALSRQVEVKKTSLKIRKKHRLNSLYLLKYLILYYNIQFIYGHKVHYKGIKCT